MPFFQIITTITKKYVSITIKHVESIDCGVYTCKMQNSVSQVSVDFTLTMKGWCILTNKQNND